MLEYSGPVQVRLFVDRARAATAQGMCKKMGRFGTRGLFEENTVDSKSRKLLCYNDLDNKRP